MALSRREFLWTMGAAGTALALPAAWEVLWADREAPGPLGIPREGPGPGWTPGLEEHVTSSCLACPARCGIRARVVDGNLVRISGNPLHPMSRGGLCPVGVAGAQTLYHPERLASPLIRTGPRGPGEWRDATREECLRLIGERLAALRSGGRPQGLALVAGYCAGSMGDLWRRFLEAFGSPNLVVEEHPDGTERLMELVHGHRRRPGYDLDRSDLVLSFGAPLFESWWSPLQAFVAYAGAEGPDGPRPRVVQVDTRFSRTAARAQQWVGVRPETHGVLALGMAYVMIRDELFDAAFVAQRASGFEDFTDDDGQPREGYRSLVTRNYRIEEVSRVTGVPVERITALARSFAAAQRPVAVCGPDVTHAPNGLLAALAVHSLNVLKGRVGRPGGILFGDEPPVAALPPATLDGAAQSGLSRGALGGPDPPFGAGGRATRFAEAVASGDGGAVEVLLLHGADPLATSERPAVWREALDKVSFVVSFSPFMDETSRFADVILPDLLPWDRWQDAPAPPSYPYPVWGIVRPMVEPHPGGTHTGNVMLTLARALGGSVAESLPWDDFESLLRSRAHGLFSARRGMTFGNEFERLHHRQMEERGWWLAEHTDFGPFWEELVERGGWADLYHDDTDPARTSRTPGGRTELLPEALLGALAVEGKGRGPYLDAGPGERPVPDGFPLRLIPYRVSPLSSWSLGLLPWLAEQPGIFPDVQWTPWIEVHPETARAAGLGDGETAWVVSSSARYRARVALSPGIAPDTVCAPCGLRHPDGEPANPLALLDGSEDPLTGLPSWFTTFVRLEGA